MPLLVLLAVFGFVAQLVDGSLGMGYGVTSTTMLVGVGVAPAAASASVHFAQIGTTLASGISHAKMGNTDWRTVSILAVPGFVGAFCGAVFLVSLDAELAKLLVATLLLLLGGYVLFRFLVLGGGRPRLKERNSPFFLVPMGLFGGTLDSIGGGGWGPVGTTTLLSSGRLEPRKVVGSVSTTEFVVAVGGSLGFLFAMHSEAIPWRFTAALLVGGVLAAPIAAYLVRHMAPRVLGVAAGGLIIFTNSRTLAIWAGASGAAQAWLLGAVAAVWVGLLVWVVRRERAVRRSPAAAVEVRELVDA
ncbi:sulfite exporter TauE/SafE family protein [Nocardioides sp. Y6]|uniref:Probable membrane transporter protein n=1 Tax=Nocardioides malaquae TaxID=2773426 RepID=A0ABR9RW39_9ACTN|nr:sulfite exporter TauE/SafE family protein [Nocardioides malaquae]MBE7325804.1 sulfite exporter TauE/SafE family protein [Nocardioides malaquae]